MLHEGEGHEPPGEGHEPPGEEPVMLELDEGEGLCLVCEQSFEDTHPP